MHCEVSLFLDRSYGNDLISVCNDTRKSCPQLKDTPHVTHWF
jgi:hypothetical protein